MNNSKYFIGMMVCFFQIYDCISFKNKEPSFEPHKIMYRIIKLYKFFLREFKSNAGMVRFVDAQDEILVSDLFVKLSNSIMEALNIVDGEELAVLFNKKYEDLEFDNNFRNYSKKIENWLKDHPKPGPKESKESECIKYNTKCNTNAEIFFENLFI